MDSTKILQAVRSNWETTLLGIAGAVLLIALDIGESQQWITADTAQRVKTIVIALMGAVGFSITRTAWKSSQDSGVRP